MAYTGMAYIVMAYGDCLYSYGLHSYGLWIHHTNAEEPYDTIHIAITNMQSEPAHQITTETRIVAEPKAQITRLA